MSLYYLTDFEWRVIKPLLPNKLRTVARVDNRRVLNGIFWVLRSGAPWRDVSRRYGAIYDMLQSLQALDDGRNWDRWMEAVTSPSNDGIAMIDCTSVRVHQLAATLTTEHPDRCLGRSRGGLTTKIHAVTDGTLLPIKIAITPGHAHDQTAATELLADLSPDGMVLADKAYDADWLRAEVRMERSWANVRLRCPLCNASGGKRPEPITTN